VTSQCPTTGHTSLRPMALADYDAVAALWRDTEGMGLGESDTRQNMATYLDRNPGFSVVAQGADGRIVGAVLCGHDGRRGYLHHLAVARDFRRRGIARAMLDACFAALAAAGIPKCNIFLFSDHDAGREFWVHNGWAHRRDLHVMQKTIAVASGQGR